MLLFKTKNFVHYFVVYLNYIDKSYTITLVDKAKRKIYVYFYNKIVFKKLLYYLILKKKTNKYFYQDSINSHI